MLNKVLTVFLLLSTIFVNTNALYAYATDIVGSFTSSQFSCIKSIGYSAIFTRIYSPVNGGMVDTNGSQNVISAYQAGLGTEVYIYPASQSTKQSYDQFDEAYNQLKIVNINVRTIWLKVTNPILWYQNPTYNINFIQGMITRARNYGVTLGILTSWYDWYEITGSTTIFQQYNLPLWYWDTYGFGPTAEGTADFSDFRSFGSWSSALAKRYALSEDCCSAIINKVVYSTTANYLELITNKSLSQPVAGSAVL